MIAKRRGRRRWSATSRRPWPRPGSTRPARPQGLVERWRTLPPDGHDERPQLAMLIQARRRARSGHGRARLGRRGRGPDRELANAILELEYTLIPHGLHVVGEPPRPRSASTCCWRSRKPRRREAGAGRYRGAGRGRAGGARSCCASSRRPTGCWPRITRSRPDPRAGRALRSAGARRRSAAHALDPAHRPQPARLRPLPHPQRLRGGRRQRQAAAAAAGTRPRATCSPESVALVLWGTDNLKSEGGPIAQALALIGAKPRFDSYGRLAGAI